MGNCTDWPAAPPHIRSASEGRAVVWHVSADATRSGIMIPDRHDVTDRHVAILGRAPDTGTLPGVTRRGALRLVTGTAAALALQDSFIFAGRAQPATPVANAIAPGLDDLISGWHVAGGFSGVIAAALGDE